MTVWYKQGVLGDLSNKCQKALGKVEKLYRDVGEDLFITSLRDGNHSAGSLHYIGDAFDIGGNHFRLDRDVIKNKLGKDFDVVNEGHHYHIEYDPK